MIEVIGFPKFDKFDELYSFLVTLSANDFIRINFPEDHSIKIVPYFNEISVNETYSYKKQIDELLKINLRLSDSLGKLHIILFKFLEENDNILLTINHVGFTKDSLNFLFANFKSIINFYFSEKKICIMLVR